MTAPRVLVIEDTPASAKLVEAFLHAMGITAVTHAADGARGLALAAEMAPDLVILDLMMPGMDGFEVCRRLRADQDGNDLPILVQTALGSADERNRVFAMGASDLVTKPLNVQEFMARVRLLLDNRALVRSLRVERVRRDHDLALAAATQQALLPPPGLLDAIHAETGVRVEGLARPSQELGGDLWGLRRLDGGRFAVFTADFAGHGVQAALNVFRLHTLLSGLPPLDDPAEVLGRLNTALCGLLPHGQFATAFYGIVEPAERRIRYAAAAAPSPLTLDGAADGSGLPLGILAGARHAERTLPLGPGRPILLTSDALPEAVDANGTPLGEDAVLARLRAAPEAPLDDLLAPLLAGLAQPLADDLTAVRLILDL